MKNNNIPEFILCSTPELARQVLEKIERESDLRWHAEVKPSYFIPDEHYPEMVIETANDRLFYSKKKYKIEDGITNFTKAEDYLNNNYMTEKTWENLQQGDVLVDNNGTEREIIGICGDAILMSHKIPAARHHLEKEGYKIKRASEDKPSLESIIKLLEDAIWKNDIENGRAARNVREAIEMLKKLK